MGADAAGGGPACRASKALDPARDRPLAAPRFLPFGSSQTKVDVCIQRSRERGATGKEGRGAEPKQSGAVDVSFSQCDAGRHATRSVPPRPCVDRGWEGATYL